jgi:hypothetical protein
MNKADVDVSVVDADDADVDNNGCEIENATVAVGKFDNRHTRNSRTTIFDDIIVGVVITGQKIMGPWHRLLANVAVDGCCLCQLDRVP